MNTLSPQNRIEIFLLSRKDFISHCTERGIYLDDDLLSYYVKNNFLSPVTIEDGEEYYDPLQIYHINQIENYRHSILELTPENKKSWQDVLDNNKERLFRNFEGFLAVMKLLQAVRYYYLPQLAGVLSIRNYITTPEIWAAEKEKFDPKPFVKKLRLTVEEIENWRIKLVSDADGTHPFKFSDWYHFLKNLRHRDHQKYDLIKGTVLLAQDFYIMAEMLTLVLEKISDKKVIPVDTIFDLTGGKWREKNCEVCGTIFQRRANGERYCGNCKKDVSKTLAGAWRCENKDCKSVLYKFIDNNELLNNILLGHKGGSQTETYARLEYGLLTLAVTCGRCGKKNFKQLRQGWWK